MSKHKKKEKTDKQKRDRSQKKNASTQNDNPKPAKQLKEKAEPIRKSSRLAGPSASSIDEPPATSSLDSATVKKPLTKSASSNAYSVDKKVNRRQPANIDGDESDNLLPLPSTQTIRKAAQDLEENDGDEDSEDVEDDEMVVEESGEPDVVSLPPKKAKEVLNNEQPRWSASIGAAPPQKRKMETTHQEPEQTVLKPSIKKGKRKRTDSSDDSNSSSKSSSDSDSDSSDTSMGSSASTLDSGAESDSSDSDTGRKASKTSKRAKERRNEAPRWKDSSNKSLKTKKHIKSSKDTNHGWPKSAHYVSAHESGTRLLSLKAQPRRLKEVLQDAIKQAEGDILFVNAYPSALDHDDYLKNVIKRCARERDYTEIVRRCSKDAEFRKAIIPVVSSRSSRIRGDAKKLIISSIQTMYKLPEDKDLCASHVHELLESLDYIYPVAASGNLERGKPYLNPLVINTLRTYFFASTRNSLADKHSNRFTSSINTDAERDNVEISIPMLSIVGTVIHAALDDWSSGCYKQTEWNADSYESAYLSHVEFLEKSICEPDPGKFHRLMSNLYKKVSSKPVAKSSSSRATKAHQRVNLAEMDD